MKTIALIQAKGGSSKTTTTHNLCGAFALRGFRVLAVDNDPQSSLTQGLIGHAAAEALDPAVTVAAIYSGSAVPGSCVIPCVVPGVDLVPGSIQTDAHNRPSPWECPRPDREALRDYLGEVAGAYDFCFIDTPPNLHLCGYASMIASEYVLIPVQPEDYGAQGLPAVRRSIERVRAGGNPSLVLLGYVLSMVQSRRSIHQLYEEKLRADYGDAVFTASVPAAADFPEAVAHRKPVTHYKPRSAAARAVVALASEVLARIEAAEGGGVAA